MFIIFILLDDELRDGSGRRVGYGYGSGTGISIYGIQYIPVSSLI